MSPLQERIWEIAQRYPEVVALHERDGVIQIISSASVGVGTLERCFEIINDVRAVCPRDQKVEMFQGSNKNHALGALVVDRAVEEPLCG